MTARLSTKDAARGKWKGVLQSLGVDGRFLTGKHGPCPLCGGKDRFRWDNRDGHGGYICGGCGSGNAFDLLKGVKGWDFKTAAAEVDKIVGNVQSDPIPKAIDPKRRVAILNRLWTAGVSICSDNPVSRYLGSRKLYLPQNTDCLRYVADCRVPGGGSAPAMIAMVSAPDGAPVTLHRTFIRPDGSGKADMDEPRALMPGPVPDGAAIRLTTNFGERLGIAEGIETALAATEKFNVPTWAAINSSVLAKWIPPEGVREVVVFGDNDKKFGGQVAAFGLAKTLANKGYEVEVKIPATKGRDWADEDV